MRVLLILMLALLSGLGCASEFPLLPMPGPVRAAAPLVWPAPACAEPDDPLERAVWEVVTEKGKRPDLSCGNRFVDYAEVPRSPEVPLDAFDQLAAQVRAARAEVLLTTMHWDAGQHPGWTFLAGLRDLYDQVRRAPEQYPQGMQVRIVLGNAPQFPALDDLSQGRWLVQALRTSGIPLEDQAAGWQLSVAVYRFFPHSHSKFHVIDGQEVTVAGWNFSDWHWPIEQGGQALHDLGLHLSGPVAQDALAVFDDLWHYSYQVRCPVDGLGLPTPAGCTLNQPEQISHPAVARQTVRTGGARAFLLYRRTGWLQADQAHAALLGAAQRSLDLMQADFSSSLPCWYAFLQPGSCPPEQWPRHLRLVLDAARRGVKVRLLTVDYGEGRLGNRSGITLLREELQRLGLSDRFEARYTNFKMHTKALTVDDRMVLVGSMNFHYGAWGQLGLGEAALATSDPQAVAGQQVRFEDIWQHASHAAPLEPWLMSRTARP